MEGTPQPPPGGEQPSEEELRARIEEQLRQVRVQDLLVESAASIVNLTARRIAKEDEQDLEQARVGIEAVRALVDLIDGEVQEQIRGALSELQLIYARAAKGEPLDGGGEGQPRPQEPGTPPGQAPAQPPQEKPASKLWTPGRD
jgi:hypothetical protein